MRAFDANIIVRLAVRDDEAQHAIALQLLTEPFLVVPTAVLEAVWVLSSIYRLSRSNICKRLRPLLGHGMAALVSGDALYWALDRYEQGGDFADMLHLALAAEAQATEFTTCDRGVEAAARDALISVETLARPPENPLAG